ncbi:DUF4174 domain-containing protein [Granulicella arctica]|uniref:DUF4174 domain-containing protein n=1 Tax=Granulicella arctica TaxID=940613 RepID=UPI0021E0AA08|nr:DUF4174 domain-containing protein [Granulicella arctica]
MARSKQALYLALAAAFFAAPSLTAQSSEPMTNRPLYVFTPSGNDPRAVEQARAIRINQPEADERQLVLTMEVTGHPTPEDSEQAALRRRFKVAPKDFVVILVGKDGGEKLRSTRPIPFDKLRDTIDSMPMRQQEAKH